MLKIAQITDLHISSKNTLKGDLDAKKRFINVLNDIRSSDIGLMIVSGDLVNSFDDIKSYEWIKSHLDKLDKKILILSGNHDCSINISDIFGMNRYLNSNELYFSVNTENYVMAFLDSSREFISKKQMEWLENLNANSSVDIVLFVHHPLDYCGCKFMDKKYPLQNIYEVRNLLMNCRKIKYIFTGHYHTEKQIDIGHIKQFITPSTWYQINGDIDGFNICKKYGWREIDIDQNMLSTIVHYI
ncbi:MAG: hypothetical protein GY756_22985 [bacterium]|nr:hypothetical protein [bacterium]